MTRTDAIWYILNNTDVTSVDQKLALLDAIQDVMYATDGSFEMEETDVIKWLDDSIDAVQAGYHGDM